MNRTIKVWAIYYTVRANSNDSWSREWTGPCGIGITIRKMKDSFLWDCLSYRPFFFRTRALARHRAKELALGANITWHWIKYTVRPLTLSWTEGD